jgi:glycosyltransferase involved in cell wall biosynthesis
MSSQSRRRVLVSAYSCEPGLGSEAGIGWNWVREIALRHDVWLLTRENNVARIVAEARELGLSNLHVEGFDLPRWARWWKRGERGAMLYFYLWQLGLAARARALDRRVDFDVVHHVTFASSWIPSGLCLVGKPFVWGPVGRHERVPDRFLERSNWSLRAAELAKAALKRCGELCDPLLWLTRARADLILSIGEDFAAELPRPWRAKTRPFLACGTELEALPRSRFARSERFAVLYAGRLVDLKGVRLALEAFARFHARAPEATFTLVGDGPCRAALEARIRELGLERSVSLLGKRSRGDVLAEMRRADVFLFPSFEGAGMVVVEAFACGAPIVCLDHGGPGEMAADGRGLKVPVERDFDATADGLAAALEKLHGDEELRSSLAWTAHRWALEHATWPAKGARLDEFYAFAERRRVGRAA